MGLGVSLTVIASGDGQLPDRPAIAAEPGRSGRGEIGTRNSPGGIEPYLGQTACCEPTIRPCVRWPRRPNAQSRASVRLHYLAPHLQKMETGIAHGGIPRTVLGGARAREFGVRAPGTLLAAEAGPTPRKAGLGRRRSDGQSSLWKSAAAGCRRQGLAAALADSAGRRSGVPAGSET